MSIKFKHKDVILKDGPIILELPENSQVTDFEIYLKQGEKKAIISYMYENNGYNYCGPIIKEKKYTFFIGQHDGEPIRTDINKIKVIANFHFTNSDHETEKYTLVQVKEAKSE